jgi:uncharacterized protein
MKEESIQKRLVDAIKSEDCEAIESLLKDNLEQITFHTPFGSQTWLGYAAQIGKLKSARSLINSGINVNAGSKRENRKPICSAAANGHYELVEYLIHSGSELDTSLSIRNPLFSAIVGRSLKIVNLLLEAGIDSKIHYDSETMRSMDAVAFALMRGETDCARAIALWNAKGSETIAQAALSEADRIANLNAFDKGRA